MKTVDYKKVGCGKNVYHTAQWLGGKLQCAKCGIELSANKKKKTYSWLIPKMTGDTQ